MCMKSASALKMSVLITHRKGHAVNKMPMGK